jgi:hypothetical protein
MRFKDRMARAKDAFKFAVGCLFEDELPTREIRGDVFIEMRDAESGRLLHKWERRNLIVYDASIQAARYFKDKDEPANSLNMLAVGTGATGAILTPDAPDPRQRKLNAEIARKAFASTTFRDTSGNAVAIPTNIVDFTTTFSEAEAVGPLNEMSLMSTISSNPLVTNPNPNNFPTRDLTVDVSLYDVIVNYLTFPVVSKPSTAILTITWRLTF